MENRIIKFRGRNIHTGEWLYGDYHREGKTHYITKPGDFLREYAPIEFIVDEKTVGQFTGLKDVNGKDIYEGDILAIPSVYDEPDETVIFCDGCFMVDDGRFKTAFCYAGVTIRSVIGNIHDNPELLNEKER